MALSRSGGNVERDAIPELSPLGSAVDVDGQPADEDGPPDEAADGRQHDVGLHRLLLRKRRSAECLSEEPDGVDGPQEGEEGKAEDEVLPAEQNLVVVGHLRAREIHGRRRRPEVERMTFFCDVDRTT